MNPSANSIPTNVLLEHNGFVRSLAYSLLRDEQLAEDAAQETWMRWLQNPPEEMGRTRGWLATVVRGVAHSRASSRRARRARELALPVAEPAGDPVHELEQAELIKSMVEGVIALDEPVQSAILLTYFRGWSTRRIAQEQGISASTVSQRVKRGLHELRTKLDGERGGDRTAWHNALVAVAGKGGSMSVLPAGVAGLFPVLPWLAAALVIAIAVSNWGPREKTPAIVMDVESNDVSVPPTDPPTVELAVQEPAQAPAVSEREVVVPATPAGQIRIAGVVNNRGYAELDMAAGPAAGKVLSILAGETGGFGSPAIRSTETLASDGRFDLSFDDPGIRPLRVALVVPADVDYHHASYRAEIKEGDRELLEVEVVRMPTGMLSGAVIDERGVALADFELVLKGRLGRDQMETACTTDKHGRFRIQHAFEVRSVEVATPRYAYLTHTGGSALVDAEGVRQPGWSDLQVTVSPSSSMSVRVTGPHGDGIAAARLTVKLHESELDTLKTKRGMFDSGASFRAETDSAGIASFANVWADRRLSIRVQVAGASHQATLSNGRKLILEKYGAGDALVLARGESREFEVRWNAEFTLTGLVLDAIGNPAVGAKVKVYDAGASNPYQRALGSFVADENGAFRWELLRHKLTGPLVLTAALGDKDDPKPAGLAALGYIGDAPSPPPITPADGATPPLPGVAQVQLPLATAVDDVLTTTLQLAPTYALAGSVRDADGALPTEGFGGARIWAVPAGSGSHLADAPLGTGQTSTRDGNFRFTGLPAGDYDIYVSKEMRGFYSFSTFMHTFPGIPAGSEHLDLVVPDQGIVQIKVRVHGVESDRMTVLHGRYFPFDSASYEKPSAPKSQEIRSMTSWPLGAPLNFTGISGDRTTEAQGALGLYGATGVDDHDLPAMGAGWYTIGVNLRGQEGDPSYSPMATPVQFFDPGQYTIDFYPEETVAVSGRVNGSAPLAIQLVDAAGESFPCHASLGMGHMEPFTETSADGRFKLSTVPVGEWRVRLGTPAELVAGEFQREVLAKFFPGMPELVLDV